MSSDQYEEECYWSVIIKQYSAPNFLRKLLFYGHRQKLIKIYLFFPNISVVVPPVYKNVDIKFGAHNAFLE